MGVTADHKEQRAGSAAEREGAEESADARSARLEWASQQTARNSRRDESPPVAVLCTVRDSVTAPDKSLFIQRVHLVDLRIHLPRWVRHSRDEPGRVFVFMDAALSRIYWHTAGARRWGHTSLMFAIVGPPLEV